VAFSFHPATTVLDVAEDLGNEELATPLRVDDDIEKALARFSRAGICFGGEALADSLLARPNKVPSDVLRAGIGMPTFRGGDALFAMLFDILDVDRSSRFLRRGTGVCVDLVLCSLSLLYIEAKQNVAIDLVNSQGDRRLNSKERRSM